VLTAIALGLRHAADPEHVAALAALATRHGRSVAVGIETFVS
jgi:high-affinity nickel permease